MGHSAPLVVSVVLLCINNSTSVATSNRLHRAETRLTLPNVGVDSVVSSPPSTKNVSLNTCRIVKMLLLVQTLKSELYIVDAAVLVAPTVRLATCTCLGCIDQLHYIYILHLWFDSLNSVKAESCLPLVFVLRAFEQILCGR